MAVQPQTISQVAALLTEDPTLILELGPSTSYINPDALFSQERAVVFIYTTDGNIHYGGPHTAHWELIEDVPGLIERYGLEDHFVYTSRNDDDGGEDENEESLMSQSDEAAMLKMVQMHEDSSEYSSSGSDGECSCSSCQGGGSDGIEPRDQAMEVGDLLGRIGPFRDGARVVSFWNQDKSDYDNLLQPCLQRLIADGHIFQSDFVSTPLHQTIPISVVAQVETTEIDPAMKKQVELYRKLHLMRGDEKKAAMRELGVGWTHRVQHPMQREMERHGLIGPGQKWWAPTSENFNSKLDAILREWGPTSGAVVKPHTWDLIEDLAGEWLDPDQFYDDPEGNARAFLYKDGQLFVGDHSEVYHALMVHENPGLVSSYDSEMEDYDIRAQLEEEGYLVGRVGLYDLIDPEDEEWPVIPVVSFWNPNESDYQDLRGCIDALKMKGVIPEGTPGFPIFVSTPIHYTVPIDSLPQQVAAPDMDDIELRRRLHTMTTGKKEAMKKLGVGGGGSDSPHPMQKALRDAGLQGPGQKWWAPTSESLVSQVASFLTDDPDVIVDGPRRTS